jgi:hypothetical protein
MSDKQKLKKLIEYMKPRPLMYLGNSFYSGMVSYINGFAAACDEDIIGSFRKWLVKTRFNCEESNFSWCELVLMLAFPHKKKGYIHDLDLSEEENLHAMQVTFSLLLEFLEIDNQANRLVK